MSTRMVGEDTELEATSNLTDGDRKETRKSRPIDAFFQPAKAVEGTKTQLGHKIALSNFTKPSQPSTDTIDGDKRENEIIQDTKASGSICGNEGQTLKKKQCLLDGKLGYQAPKQDSSLEEELKPKQRKHKWSVTCAVRNTSKLLNSSGSDFEDDGKDLFNAKNKLEQKSCKKKVRDKKRTAQECKGNISKLSDDKEKEIETSQVKHTGEESQRNIDIEAKVPVTSGNSEQTKEFRTSAFDVLMNRQMVRKPEDDGPQVSVDEFQDASIEIISETSNSCDIVDCKEMLHSNSNVTKLLESRKDSSSDRNHFIKNTETNAFDLLMKKGKSPKKGDSQLQLEPDKLPQNFDGSPKKKPKKKSFEFHLSILGGKKKDVDFVTESDNLGTDVQNCERSVKRKRKRRKPGDGSELLESESDEAILSENSKEVVVVSKSKRGRQTSKVANEKHVEGDKVVMDEKGKSEKKGRRTGNRSTSTGSELSYTLHVREARCGSEKKQQRGNNDVDAKEMKEKRNVKARKGGDTASTQGQFQDKSPCSEDLEMPKRRGDQKKKNGQSSKEQSSKEQSSKEQSSKEQSSIDSRIVDERQEKADSEKEKGTKNLTDNEKTATCKEPKPLASIFLKKKALNPKADILEEQPTDLVDSVSSPTTTSTTTADNTADKSSTSDMHSSSLKEKLTINQEAAKKAFNALFTGARHQKTPPVVTAAEVLPAPWPTVSHVVQKEHHSSLGVNFWSLPWPIGRGHKSDDISGSLLPEDYISNAMSQEDKVMFSGPRAFEQSLCHSKRVEPKTTTKSRSEAITKSIVSELALFYPGIPLRKLYKRYSSKLQKYRVNSTVADLEQTVPEKKPDERVKSRVDSLGDKDGKGNIVAYSLCNKREKGKQQLSCDGERSLEKEIARKKDDLLVSEEKQGPVTNQPVEKPRQKRRREDDGDQYQVEVIEGRRLSLRIRRKKTTLESDTLNNNLEIPETTSNRKKRKRTGDYQDGGKETSEPSTQFNKAVEIPVVPNSCASNVETFVNDALWTELYRPLHSTEVMANASSVSKLRSWLQEWKIKREKTLRKELQQQKRLLAKQKGKQSSHSQGSSRSLEWWDADSDSDFQMSDHASDDSDTEEGGLNTAMFISGPTGVGKTAMVYACAEELGYKVFEVNSSSKRSGKQIMSQLEEATQSHLVINNKGPAPQSSFAGLFDKPVNSSPPSTGPLSAFLQKNTSVSETKASKNGKRKKDRDMKEKKKVESKGKGKSILKQPSQQIKDDSESCSNLSSKAASLILFEEVDVIFEEDKSFWMAVNSFMQNAKCPIVLISTDSQVSCEGRYEQVKLKSPSVNLLAAHLQLVALTNNIFVNPGDLKSLVVQNNCDIRKSLFDLQFWSGSGGGVKMPYTRPVSLEPIKNDVGRSNLKPQHTSVTCKSGSENLKTGISSQDVNQFEPLATGGILNDDGEESLFLSLSDWQAIKNRGATSHLRSSTRGTLGQAYGDNSDSDFFEPKRAKLSCPEGSADSVFEITDTNDSQPASTVNEKADTSRQLPPVDSLLFESVHGMLNCVADPTVGSLSILQKGKKSGDNVKDYGIFDKLRLTHFTQGLDLNLVQTNLSNLIPLFAESSSSLPQTRRDPQEAPLEDQTTDVEQPIAEEMIFKSVNIFSDRSLFDDGTDESTNKGETEVVTETDHSIDKESEDGKTKLLNTSQDSVDTGFSESQPKEGTSAAGEGEMLKEDSVICGETILKGKKPVRKTHSHRERCCTKALDIFAQFAENQSFLDAFCPSLSVSNTQSSSVDFGWWEAVLKPGLTDEHVTVEECSHWLARDTRASIRAASEVANLESCRTKVNCLANDLKEVKNVVEEESPYISENELFNSSLISEDLPPRDCGSLLQLISPTLTQRSSTASRRKLCTSMLSCIPSLYHCDHRCVASDYIPTFRLLCHSERLREASNVKRRFLHYLDLNSFPLSRSTMEALADSYLGQ